MFRERKRLRKRPLSIEIRKRPLSIEIRKRPLSIEIRKRPLSIHRFKERKREDFISYICVYGTSSLISV